MGFVKFSTLLFSVLIVGVIVVGLSMFWTNLATDYNVDVNEAEFASFNSSFNNIRNLTEEINKSYKGMEALEDSQEEGLSKLEGMSANFWSTIRLMFGSVELVTQMAAVGTALLGAGEVGTALRVALIAIIILSLVFTGVYLIFKVKI